jgi:hypothetical protein
VENRAAAYLFDAMVVPEPVSPWTPGSRLPIENGIEARLRTGEKR